MTHFRVFIKEKREGKGTEQEKKREGKNISLGKTGAQGEQKASGIGNPLNWDLETS